MNKCQYRAEVVWNRLLGPGYFRMGFRCQGKVGRVDPGQFVMVRLDGQQSPLLRRPFSIHELIVESGEIKGFEILYKVVGTGTSLLSKCREGDGIDVLGPLGKGFRLPKPQAVVYLVSGGIGVAPFLFLLSRMQAAGYEMSRVTAFMGGRSRGDLLCTETFRGAGMTLRLSTDDGSRGERGLVTEPLEACIKERRPGMLYACGPMPMLKKVAAISENYGISCQMSIETIMACGMGACLGCAVAGRSPDSPYWHACLDGPVFDAGDITLG